MSANWSNRRIRHAARQWLRGIIRRQEAYDGSMVPVRPHDTAAAERFGLSASVARIASVQQPMSRDGVLC
jgi:hypothetical protein